MELTLRAESSEGIIRGSRTNFRVINTLDEDNLLTIERETVLFYHPAHEALAESIAQRSSNVSLGIIHWR